jgi:hypothetical protein
MDNLSLTRFLILAKIIEHQGILEGQFIRLIQQLPQEFIELTKIPTETNSIYQIIHRLKKCRLIQIGTPRFIYPTQEGLDFYRKILSFCPSIPNITKDDEIPVSTAIQHQFISISNIIPPSSQKISEITESREKTESKVTSTSKKHPQSQKISQSERRSSNKGIQDKESAIIQQFCTYFDPIIKDYRWSGATEKLGLIMKNLLRFWNKKLPKLAHTANYPAETTSMMIGWLGLTSEKCGVEGRADIEAGLEFCWMYYLKEN